MNKTAWFEKLDAMVETLDNLVSDLKAHLREDCDWGEFDEEQE